MNKVPRTPFKVKSAGVNFNLSRMIGSLFVGRIVLQMCEAAKFVDAESYVAGIIKGYTDWFEELKIDKETMATAIKGLDREACAKSAQDVFRVLADSLKKPLIEIPGVPPADIKKILDNVHKGKG